jgi:hypothetical protein
LTISGANFVAGATVTLGGVAATSVNVTGGSTISAVSPAHAAGTVDVTVTNSDGQSATLVNGYTYTQSSPLGVVLLEDDFDDNAIDAAKWNAADLFSGLTDTNLPIAEINQRLEIGPLLQGTGGSHYAGLRSMSTYDFTNAYCYVQVVQAASSATGADAMLTLGRDVNGYYRIYVEGGSIIFQKRLAGSKFTLLTASYNAANDAYWRIRNDAASGNVIFETAPDNNGLPGTWAVRFTESWNTTAIPLSTVRFEIKGGTWQAESNAPGKVLFDNFKAARP